MMMIFPAARMKDRADAEPVRYPDRRIRARACEHSANRSGIGSPTRGTQARSSWRRAKKRDGGSP